MANIDLSLAVICEQRRRRSSLILTPPVRYNPDNPYLKYPQYNQRDFDMRRKAEILKYNKSSSQSNPKLTRAQKWSHLVGAKAPAKNSFNNTILYQNDNSGNYIPIIVKYPDTYTVSQELAFYDLNDNPIYRDVYTIIPGKLPSPCPTNFNTPSSSSNVPGPIINLYLDENVPLVYYNTNFQSYGITNPSNPTPWTTVSKNNIFYSDSINNLLTNLIINNTISQYALTYSIKVPISIYFTATTNVDVSNGPIYLPNNSIGITAINAFTYFNGKQITYLTQPVITLDHDETLQFDISFNKQYINTITYDSKGIAIQNPYYNNTITLQYFLGNLNITNLYLLTAASYIYDIDLNFVMSTTGLNAQFDSFFNITAIGVYCNVDAIGGFAKNIAKNIVLKNTGSYALSAFQISAS